MSQSGTFHNLTDLLFVVFNVFKVTFLGGISKSAFSSKKTNYLIKLITSKKDNKSLIIVKV